ncbi:MAG: hypothetical protein A3H27_00200 [Acidobacteria bacterium RIFCSPLOWO2_02_FULL_59_13]|nr:MAG: hypothetical protein A3H27_00200 [Acidobacteria bacterium RIFCSPLOWO2_02_FULL_59_13]
MRQERGPEAVLRETIQQARTATGTHLEALLYHRSPEVLEALLDNPRLNDQHVHILLQRKDLSRAVVTRIAQNKEWMKSYPLMLALVKHPRSPRYVTLQLLKMLYLFDLVGVATTPGVPADLKRLAEDHILAQGEGISLGQRLTMARRSSSRIAAGLLADSDRRVIEAALSNPALTEQGVVAALRLEKASPELPEAVADHTRWSSRHWVKLALLRNRHLSLARLMGILSELSSGDLTDLISDPRVANNIRAYVARMVHHLSTLRKRDGL